MRIGKWLESTHPKYNPIRHNEIYHRFKVAIACLAQNLNGVKRSKRAIASMLLLKFCFNAVAQFLCLMFSQKHSKKAQILTLSKMQILPW
ncbi:hypothetical protein H6G64_25810 [Calothrix sp. FACHB-156]|nr:hypothetical protein [Calothrix sp. FACHB-156]